MLSNAIRPSPKVWPALGTVRSHFGWCNSFQYRSKRIYRPVGIVGTLYDQGRNPDVPAIGKRIDNGAEVVPSRGLELGLEPSTGVVLDLI